MRPLAKQAFIGTTRKLLEAPLAGSWNLAGFVVPWLTGSFLDALGPWCLVEAMHRMTKTLTRESYAMADVLFFAYSVVAIFLVHFHTSAWRLSTACLDGGGPAEVCVLQQGIVYSPTQLVQSVSESESVKRIAVSMKVPSVLDVSQIAPFYCNSARFLSALSIRKVSASCAQSKG